MAGAAFDIVGFLFSSSSPFPGVGLAGVELPPDFFLGAAFALAATGFFAGFFTDFLAADRFAIFFAEVFFALAGRFFAARFLVFAIDSSPPSPTNR